MVNKLIMCHAMSKIYLFVYFIIFLRTWVYTRQTHSGTPYLSSALLGGLWGTEHIWPDNHFHCIIPEGECQIIYIIVN